MKKNLLLPALSFLLLVVKFSLAQPGTIDTTFNVYDMGTGNGANQNIHTTSIQSDGKIIIGGDFTVYNGLYRDRITRINADGSPDTTFNPSGGADNIVNTTSIQTDGKIIIGGWFTGVNGQSRYHITRLNTDGALDTTFNANGLGADFAVLSTSIQSDGKIIIGGQFTFVNGQPRNHITRLNTDGTLDTSFNANGSGADGSVYTISIQSDGKIIIGGDFTLVNGQPRNRIARLNTDGTFDGTFNPTGSGANYVVYTTAIQSDGKIIIGGNFTVVNGQSRNSFALLNTDGTLDATFNQGTGLGGTSNLRTTSIQTDGKIIIGGQFSDYNGTGINGIARINTDGSLDTTFNPGTGIGGYLIAIAIQADGKIIMGGSFSAYNGMSKNCIARANDDGSLDTAFDFAYGANEAVYTTSIQSDGKIIVGGNFTFVNGQPRNRIARLNTDGSLDTTFNPGTAADNYVWSTSIQSDGKIIIGGLFTNYNGTTRNHIARLNTDGSLDAAFNPGTGANAIVSATSIQSDGKIIIGGDFTDYGGTARNRIARINTDGSLDVAFNPSGSGANYAVYTTAIQSDGKIIIGGIFTLVNGQPRNRIARLNTDGTFDGTFNPAGSGANQSVFTSTIQSDGKIIIGGDFTTVNGQSREKIARLNTNGSLDGTFNPIFGGVRVLATSLQSDGKIIAGGLFYTVNGQSRNFIARLDTTGTLDAAFNPGTGANSNVFSTSIQGDGKIIIAGAFNIYNGTGKNRVARVNGDNITSVEEITEDDVLLLFPNPLTTQSKLTFKNNNKEKYLFTLYDITGRATESVSTTNNEIILTKGSKPAGVYLFNLTNEKTGERWRGKIVISD